MQLYAIQHTTTGNYLTDRYVGGSWWEGEPYKGSPKLFKTLGSAKGWRTNWLKGSVKTEHSQDWETGYEKLNLVTIPRPNRTRDQLTIIPVTLTFGEPLCLT